jgi:hypothetical protein
VRDRLIYRSIGVAVLFVSASIILGQLKPPSPIKAVVGTILVIGCVGMIFGNLVLMTLKNNPEAYNWMDPDLKLARRKEKEKSKENYYAYDPEQREAIVNDYRESRARREITNKNAWSQSKYNISSATLRKYEREFPKKKK